MTPQPIPAQRVARNDVRCPCGLPLDRPQVGRWWFPFQEPDPGPFVYGVMLHGAYPTRQWFARTSRGWIRLGPNGLVTLPIPWRYVGLCSEWSQHPVVPARL